MKIIHKKGPVGQSLRQRDQKERDSKYPDKSIRVYSEFIEYQ